MSRVLLCDLVSAELLRLVSELAALDGGRLVAGLARTADGESGPQPEVYGPAAPGAAIRRATTRGPRPEGEGLSAVPG